MIKCEMSGEHSSNSFRIQFSFGQGDHTG